MQPATRKKLLGNQNKAPTLVEVARLAGTTKGTASRALNGRHWVRPQTRDAVLQAARELGFRADPTAQRLANGRSNALVGLFTPYLDLGVLTRKLQLLQTRLSEQSYETSIHACGSGKHDQVRQARTLADLCRQKPAAIVCYTLDLHEETICELQRFCESGGIAVCYDTPFELKGGLGDYVLFDRDDNTYRAARHLVELGHTRIGLLSSASQHETNRLRGFRRALREGGVEWKPKFSMVGTRFFKAREMPLAEQIGQRAGAMFCTIAESERPSAICITDDYVATVFIAELMRHGLHVPGDVSVVGHDDMPIGEYACSPALTTVSQPIEAIASGAVQLLASRLNGEYSGPARRIVVQGDLIVRGSTAPPL